MKRIHAALVSLLLGVAAVAGVLALERTVALGPKAPSAAASISVRQAQLDRVASQIDALRRAAPPAATGARKEQVAPEQVVYVRAAPPARAHAGEREAGHELDDGGGFDD